jgi:hypothetical protein
MKKIALLFSLCLMQIVFSQNKEYIIKNSNINTDKDNFGITFCSEDFVIYVGTDKSNKRKVDTDFYLGYLDETGNIINSKKLSGNVNSKFSEIDAIFSKDFKTVYFTRKTNYRRSKTHYELFKADVVTPGYWINISKVWFNDKNYSVAHPALSTDGKTLYFASDMPGSYGKMDLYKSTIYDNGKLGKPENLGKRFNTIVDEITPFINNVNILYFASDGRAGYGGLDIYAVNLNDDSNPYNLDKPINSTKDDYYYVEKLNDNKGHFVSNRDGGNGKTDIYYFEITNNKKIHKKINIPFSEKERKRIYSKNKPSKKIKGKEKTAKTKQRKELLGY